jgi:hypothetical protein
MVFFFCGAPKHGSHFQMFILTESLVQKGMPYEQVGNEIFHRRKLRRAKRLLDQLMGRNENVYVCKGHFGSRRERDFLLSYDRIKIFLIWRDLRDVLVSQYFYDMNKGGKTFKDFQDFYWKRGRWFLCYHVKFRRNWEGASKDPRVFTSAFPELKRDFSQSAVELLRFSGIEGVDTAALQHQLSMERLRVKHNDPKKVFFRRGDIGEHRDIIGDQRIYEDIVRITNLDVTPLNIFYYRTMFPIFNAKLRGMLLQHSVGEG